MGYTSAQRIQEPGEWGECSGAQRRAEWNEYQVASVSDSMGKAWDVLQGRMEPHNEHLRLQVLCRGLDKLRGPIKIVG